jgi:hypothetical protein
MTLPQWVCYACVHNNEFTVFRTQLGLRLHRWVRWLREAPLFWPCRYCGGIDGVNGCFNCWGKRPHYAAAQRTAVSSNSRAGEDE